MLDPAAPQLVVNSRTLYFSWLPADPDAVAALVPPGLCPRPDRQVFLNQYIVDDETQTSGFGAYSLTYLGVSLLGVDAPGGLNAGGWWTHYVASSRRVREYAVARGAPVLAGRTRIEVNGEDLLSETEIDGTPLIRARCRVGETGHAISSGHHRYFTRRDGQLLSSAYPFVAEPVAPFEIESVEFLQPRPPDVRAAPGQPADHRLRLLLTALVVRLPRWAERARGSPRPEPARPLHQVPASLARSGLPSGS